MPIKQRLSGSSADPANLLGVMGIGLAGIGLYSLQASTWSRTWSVAAVGILVAEAAGLFGGLLGFLFGIPRTLQSDSVSHDEAGARSSPEVKSGENVKPVNRTSYLANTNLEQISDWLTKILVGVGLTQISPILNKAGQLSTFIAKGMGSPDDGQVIAAAILAFFCVSGFLLGYLWTRLYLPSALHESDLAAAALDEAQHARAEAEQANARVEEVMRQQLADAKALGIAHRQLKPATGEPPVELAELRSSIMLASSAVREHIFSEAQNQRWKSEQFVSVVVYKSRSVGVWAVRAVDSPPSLRLDSAPSLNQQPPHGFSPFRIGERKTHDCCYGIGEANISSNCAGFCAALGSFPLFA